MEDKMISNCAARESSIGELTHKHVSEIVSRIEDLSMNFSDKLQPVCSGTDIEPESCEKELGNLVRPYPPLFESLRNRFEEIERAITSLEDTLSRVGL